MKKIKDFFEMYEVEIIGIVISFVIAIVCYALGLTIANWIGNSDLPEWMKLYLLTH